MSKTKKTIENVLSRTLALSGISRIVQTKIAVQTSVK